MIFYATSQKSGKMIPLDLDLQSAPAKVNGALFFLSEDWSRAAPIENAEAVLSSILAGETFVQAKFAEHDSTIPISAARVAVSHFKTCNQASRF